MRIRSRFLSLSLLSLLTLAPIAAQAQSVADHQLSPQEKYKQGHSRHGEAYDEGPREKPWPMEGLTITPFPITTKNPEAQKWFDQGVTLLHSFWFYEAERAFRWSLKLDPDCAMAYWGLARAASDQKRADAFLKEAVKLLDRVKALGLRAEPKDVSPRKQRNYKQTPLDKFGPGQWVAYAAPKFDAIDAEKKQVTLEEYRGKNVALIFYIGQECSHCVGQLKDLAKRAEELKGLGVEVLAASSNTPEEDASAMVKDLKARLLSDVNFENARRFKSCALGAARGRAVHRFRLSGEGDQAVEYFAGAGDGSNSICGR